MRNSNDLAASATRIAAESRTFYLLGFHPPAGKADAWRKLRVSVRRDGVTVRARRGYTRAGATQAPIPVRLASYVLEPMADGKTRVVAVAEIDTAGAGTDLQMRLEAVPLAGTQTQVQDVSLQSSGAATASSWKAARLGLALPAGVHDVRVFVRDAPSGRHGAASQRVVIAEPGAFRLSTLLFTDRGVPVAHAAFAPQLGQSRCSPRSRCSARARTRPPASRASRASSCSRTTRVVRWGLRPLPRSRPRPTADCSR